MSSPFMSSPEETNDAPAAPAAGGAVNKLLTVALLAIVCVFGWKFFGPKPSLAGWNKDWNAGVAQAQSTGKPAVVLFTADWCPPCRQLKADTLSDSTVRSVLQDRFTPVMVDLTDRGGPNDRLAADHQVQGIPTIILFDRNGKELRRTYGMPPDDFLRWLNSGR